jgi:hypothetical protein
MALLMLTEKAAATSLTQTSPGSTHLLPGPILPSDHLPPLLLSILYTVAGRKELSKIPLKSSYPYTQ